MKIEELAAFGISERAIGNWQTLGRRALLPLQTRVVRETGLLRGENVVVFSPTSSGKTFVAEMAAVRQWERGRKSVFLVPTKALAEEQYAHLRRVYEPLGIRVVVATRERTAHDARIARGDFDFAVMVYEKLKAFLASSPRLLGRIGLVAVDELQILGDPGRGDTVDLLLSRITSEKHGVQLVGLSAVLAENARLAAWLRSEMFVWRERPIELREGVFRLSDGAFVYREYNSGREGTEIVPSGDAESFRGRISPEPANFHFPAVEYLVEEFVGRGEQVLVFVPTRHLSRQWAWSLGRNLPMGEAHEALAELEQYEESHSRSLLEECFRRSVAFHNSDLPHDLRGMVEREFNAGNLRVLVATSTLAQGVNLRVRNVISVPAMMGTDRATGTVGYVPLRRQLWRNQGGRAGRLVGGEGEAFGRSILIADDEAVGERLLRDYVLSDVEPLEPPISEASLERLTLDLVQSGHGRTAAELRNVLMETYSARIGWGARETDLVRGIEGALEHLAAARLLVRRGDGRLQPTGLGQAASAYGLHPDTVAEFLLWCAESGPSSHCTEFEVLALCAGSPDGQAFSLTATAAELRAQRYPIALAQRREIDPEAMHDPVRARLQPEGTFPDAAHTLLKKAFAAEAWISDRPTHEIEEEFQLFAGTLANLGAHLSWLAQALAALASAGGVPSDVVEQIRALAHRLPDGLPPGAEQLAALGVAGLSRSYILALARQGFDSPEALAESDADTLERWLPRGVAERLVEAAREARAGREAPEADGEALAEENTGLADVPAVASVPRRLTPAEELDLLESGELMEEAFSLQVAEEWAPYGRSDPPKPHSSRKPKTSREGSPPAKPKGKSSGRKKQSV